MLILNRCQTGDNDLLGSKAIDDELKRTSDVDRRQQMQLWVARANIKVSLTEQIKFRARELTALGFKDYDALHIACAEVGKADILLTTDDRMLRLAARHSYLLQVKVENPLRWLMEVTQ